ncbi:MAG: mechanosensitive ion channel family protein [Acidobacteria bacterium]|nr:mechanosensitive ion channel family protein [Acidobacteriota bacterium]
MAIDRRTSSPRRLALLILAGLVTTLTLTSLVLPPPARAQALPGLSGGTEEASDEAAAETPEPTPAPPPAERASPRATMATFLEAMNQREWERAIATLNLRREGYSDDVVATRGRDLAAELKAVIDRVAFVDLEEIPGNVGGRSSYAWQTVDGIPIELERLGEGEWLFSRETLDRLPDLWEAVKDRKLVEGIEETPTTPAMWMRQQVPETLRQGGLLLEYWQWLALAILIFVGVLVERTVTFVLQRIVARQLSRRLAGRTVEDSLVTASMRPLGLVAMAVLWWLGLLALGLPPQALAILLVAVKFFAIAALVWAAYRAVDVGAAVLESYAAGTETRYDDLLIPLLRTSAKIFIGAFGVVFLADNLDINITGLLAGLGIGGIAFALAAQDTVKNFFGSVTVLMDRPFQVGDWVVIGKIEGTVETVGFRSTRIRTFYNSLITLPNSNLISAEVDNYGARRYRRWKTHLGVAYDTPPEKIDVLCEGIRELVRRHPYTRKDYFHVYLNQYGPSSLDILLYIFWETPDWATELRERHRLAVDILRLTRHLGVEIAYPTQTLYLKRGGETTAEAFDDAYARSVAGGEEQVRRDVRELVDAELDGKIPPPVGFATSRVDGEASE